jgi:hypothetical protein
MFCGGIGVFLYQLAGLHHEHAVAGNHARIKLDAAAVLRVGAAGASLETPHGLLHWNWALEKSDGSGSLRVELSIPHGYVTGQLELPLLDHHSALSESGAVVWSRGDRTAAAPAAVVGMRGVAARDAGLVVDLHAGDYVFVAH